MERKVLRGVMAIFLLGGGDCCKWKRVECNIFTGRIIRLFLNLTAIEHQHGFFYTYHVGNGVEYYWGKREQWYLNVSLFLPFSRIKEWKFNSWKKGELRAMKLEVLDLSVNFFNNTILSFLALLSNLKFLNIKSNRLEGAIHIKDDEIEIRLMKLKVFHSSHNLFNNSILRSFDRLSNYKSLYFGDTKFYEPMNLKDSEIWKSYSCKVLGHLTSLKRLVLYKCEINGSLALQGFCGMTNLQELDFTNSNLKGGLPNCFSNLTSLRKLDLISYNIALHSLKSLETLARSFNISALQRLHLYSNNFSRNISALETFRIPISLGPLFNLSKLKCLYADNNIVHAETQMHSLAPLFQLKDLSLSCCGDVGSFPRFFYHQHDLQYLDLSNIYFKGNQFPHWLLENNTLLEKLVFTNSSLSGPLQLPFASQTRLSHLEISCNFFNGNIPVEIGAQLPALRRDPRFLVYEPFFLTLDVSNNQLSGRIPRWMGDMSFLKRIIMSNNHLERTIPVVLRGTLPDVLRNSSTSVKLDISDNFLSGSIPSWIGLLNLSYLLLSKNNFQGETPMELCKLSHLSLINLSHNNLSGRIPPCLKITTLQDVSEDYVGRLMARGFSIFSFNEPIEFPIKNVSNSYKGRIIPYISGIDLSCNKLVAKIPYEFGNFYKLLVLDLSHNSLTGPIPPTFVNLIQIESLDLSYNNLSGNIPYQLVGLNFQAYFIVSFNNLSGKTPPRIAQFGTFDESSYKENPFRCGEPLPECADNGPSLSMPNSSTNNAEDDDLIDMGVFHISFIVSYTILLMTVVVSYINPY
ncbi:hypothetical protein ES288_D06G077500v1 [Gossypium darwinii]|uniref:Leucine-rich repeat-containing N-terminal plant-type domain-containing protein n=1 Tax=Gossypium darwinii TaxID=34276 RepID=A0A5D2C756_GOSDA|nr:hypothetical protein ES288_D06G077500v1 [Gossypium darwinii]